MPESEKNAMQSRTSGGNKVIWEKISYVHNNPVEAGLVYRAQDYVYSSAADYADEKGLLNDIVVFRYYG